MNLKEYDAECKARWDRETAKFRAQARRTIILEYAAIALFIGLCVGCYTLCHLMWMRYAG